MGVLKIMSCTILDKGKHYCFTDENSPSFMIVSYGNGRKVVINPDAKMEHLRSFFHERLETDYLQDFVDHFKNIVKKERENYEDERATPSKFTRNRQTRLHKSELDRVCDSNYEVSINEAFEHLSKHNTVSLKPEFYNRLAREKTGKRKKDDSDHESEEPIINEEFCLIDNSGHITGAVFFDGNDRLSDIFMTIDESNHTLRAQARNFVFNHENNQFTLGLCRFTGNEVREILPLIVEPSSEFTESIEANLKQLAKSGAGLKTRQTKCTHSRLFDFL